MDRAESMDLLILSLKINLLLIGLENLLKLGLRQGLMENIS